MRRDVGRHGRFLLPALLAVAFVGCGSAAVATLTLLPGASCACATQPGPTGTPPPVTATEAESAVTKVAHLPARFTDLVHGPADRLMWQVSSAGSIGFVDAVTGELLEVVIEDAMPDHDVVSISESAARTAAETLVTRAGLTPVGSAATTTLHRGGVAAIQVAWTDATASPGNSWLVFVNAESGSVFAFVSSSPSFDPVVPVVGKVRAGELALAAVNWPGMTVEAADWGLYFALDGSQLSTWIIALGEPSSTQADVYIHGAAVEVNAVSGATTIMKSDTGR